MNRDMNNIYVVLALLVAQCYGNTNLITRYEWKLMDFQYENNNQRQEDIDGRAFISKNVIPTGIDVYENRLFVALPRLKSGVPASLATIDLNEAIGSSPSLRPYPSWQAHRVLNTNDTPDIVSAFHIKIDRCHRLWVLDTGVEGQLNDAQHTARRLAPVRILIFDLKSDNLIREFSLPLLNTESSIFFNIAVDDNDCRASYAYIAKAGIPPSLTVYAFEANESWQVKHNFFNIDPLAGNFSNSNMNYHSTDGIYGLALSEPRSNGFPDLYFHALTSFNEFNVSTAVLRNKGIAESPAPFYKDFMNVGHRGPNGQSGVSTYDFTSGVIFYTLPNSNAIGCWKTSSDKYSITNGNLDKIPYPIDIKIDNDDRLWILSNNLQMFMNGNEFNSNQLNFHVHVIPVEYAVRDTACEPDFINNVVNKFNKAIRIGGKVSSAASQTSALLSIVVATVFLLALL